jgi:hypothetical protein
MSTTPRCQSKYGPEGCTDADCPQRVAGFQQFMTGFIQAPPSPAKAAPAKVAPDKAATQQAAMIAKVGAMTTPFDTYDLVDENIIHTFSNADCWALALELHEMTGWDLVGFGEELYEDDDDIVQRGWVHAAVRTPAGMIVDINGVQHEGDVFDGLPEEAEESFTTDVSLFKGTTRYYPDVDANEWAKKLLATISA